MAAVEDLAFKGSDLRILIKVKYYGTTPELSQEGWGS
jgi:hypothetical protein